MLAGSSVACASGWTQIAEPALDPEAVRADGGEMRAAGDEGDVVAGRREPRAEVAADGARRHHRIFILLLRIQVPDTIS